MGQASYTSLFVFQTTLIPKRLTCGIDPVPNQDDELRDAGAFAVFGASLPILLQSQRLPSLLYVTSPRKVERRDPAVGKTSTLSRPSYLSPLHVQKAKKGHRRPPTA